MPLTPEEEEALGNKLTLETSDMSNDEEFFEKFFGNL
jgi:hypothetical protein